MSLTNAEMNYFFDLTVTTKEQQGDISYLNQLVLVSQAKDKASAGVFSITSEDDLAKYLEDTENFGFLKEAKRGLKKLSHFTLWAIPDDATLSTDNTTFAQVIADGLSGLNEKAFTLMFSVGYNPADLIQLDLSDFRGVKFVSLHNYQDIDDAFVSWGKKEHQGLICDDSQDGWGLELLSLFLGSPDFSNMQYADQINSTSNVPAPAGNWEILFEDRITHLVSSGSLGLFAVGGRAVVDTYIQEKTRFEIQQAFAEYISTYHPIYDDASIHKLEDAAYFVLQSFKTNQKIADFTNPTIPKVTDQDPTHRDALTLGGFQTTITMAGSIWKIQGNIIGE